jgi:hypothetical protein
MTLDLVKASAQDRRVTNTLMSIGEMRSVLEFAPYAVSVLRLFLAFVCGLATGFIGPRPTNYIDLQYLYYSPFCMVFASNDKFHREMWRATSGLHSFVWGQDLKDDLHRRIASREKINEPATDATNRQDSSPPPHSVIAEIWGTYMRATEKSDQAGRAKTLEDLDPEIQQQFRDAMKEFDRMDQARRG